MIKLIIAATVLLSCTAQKGNSQQSMTSNDIPVMQDSKSIYSFTVEALDGTTINFAEFKGKNVVILRNMTAFKNCMISIKANW